MAYRLGVVLTLLVCLFLAGCGSDGGASSTDETPSAAEVAAITPAELRTYSSDQIVALGTNIKYLSDAALAALSGNNSAASGQIAAITAEQIVVLTPAQVRLLGAAGEGGSITTSKVGQLNSGAWAALVEDQEQVAAFTADEIPTFAPSQILALGTNIQFLADEALAALTPNNSAASGQIAAITAKQIDVLSPEQVSVIAASNGNKGISFLNDGAMASLSPEQIAILTVEQKASLSTGQHTACGC